MKPNLEPRLKYLTIIPRTYFFWVFRNFYNFWRYRKSCWLLRPLESDTNAQKNKDFLSGRKNNYFRNIYLKVDILQEGKNVTPEELGKVTDFQWLEFSSARTENVNRVIKEISKRKLIWRLRAFPYAKGSDSCRVSSLKGYSEVLTWNQIWHLTSFFL